MRTTGKGRKVLRAVCLMLCLALVLCACSSGREEESTSGEAETVTGGSEAAFEDGVYHGSAAGMHSTIEVSVTVSDGKIADIEILSQAETPSLTDPAFEQVPAAIIESQSLDVETVSGATVTSEAIIAAVRAALEGGEMTENAPLAIEPDVIVVGAGMAGLATAVKSTELGLNVLLLEQSVRVGGCSHYSGGTISGAGFKIQQENGVEDTPEAFYEEILALGGEENINKDLARTHTQNAGRAIDWLDEVVGVDFADRGLVGGSYTQMDTLRITRALGSYSIGAGQGFLDPLSDLVNEAVAAGTAQLLLNTEVTELLVENGECIGVKCGDTEYRAPSVVLCTGGYGYDEELLKSNGLATVITTAPATSNGSGYRMALAIGGVLDNMDSLVQYFGGGIPTDGFDMTYQANTSYPGAVFVDENGDRLGDEAANGNKADLWAKAGDSTLYVIISGNMVSPDQAFLRKGTAFNASQPLENNGWDRLEELAAEGKYAFKADTIEELADLLGTSNLPETVALYNADVLEGADSLYGRDPETMTALEEGPYYALLTVPFVWSGTPGGVRADGDGRLVLEDGTAVEGLFLAGEILGPMNIMGDINFGGINHSMCITWGILAAEHAAERAQK